MDAGHSRLSGRCAPPESVARAVNDCGASCRLSHRLPLRFDCSGHQYSEEIRRSRTPLSFVACRTRDPWRGRTTRVACVRAGVSRASGGRRRRPQFLRAETAGGDLKHDRARPQLLGEPDRHAPRRSLASSGARAVVGRSLAGRSSFGSHSEPHALRDTDQSPDLPWHGLCDRHRLVAAHLPARFREESLGPE